MVWAEVRYSMDRATQVPQFLYLLSFYLKMAHQNVHTLSSQNLSPTLSYWTCPRQWKSGDWCPFCLSDAGNAIVLKGSGEQWPEVFPTKAISMCPFGSCRALFEAFGFYITNLSAVLSYLCCAICPDKLGEALGQCAVLCPFWRVTMAWTWWVVAKLSGVWKAFPALPGICCGLPLVSIFRFVRTVYESTAIGEPEDPRIVEGRFTGLCLCFQCFTSKQKMLSTATIYSSIHLAIMF